MPLLAPGKFDVDTGLLSVGQTQPLTHGSTIHSESSIPLTESNTAASYLRDSLAQNKASFLQDFGDIEKGHEESLVTNEFPNFGYWNERVHDDPIRCGRPCHSLETLVSHRLPSPTLSDTSSPHLNSTGTAGQNGSRSEEPAGKARRAPRKRKVSEKAAKLKVPKLTKPLSELTKDYHLPFRNMEAWVHRSPETRWKEVRKRGGYITRPMNSFMLYRSAYAERTKFWCTQNNHQVVSSVSGVSWPLEPPEIRGKYNELARIERMNHQAAHPGYKFSPSKAQGTRKRKVTEDESSSVLDELDDNLTVDVSEGGSGATAGPGPFYQTLPADFSKEKGTSRRKIQSSCGLSLSASSSSSSPTTSNLLYMGLSYDTAEGGPVRSSFNHSNPGKTPPLCMENANMNGHYYRTVIHQSSVTPIPNPMASAVIEDITIHPTAAPAGALDPLRIRMNTIENVYPPHGKEINNSQVDPALLDCSPSHQDPSGPDDAFTPRIYSDQNIGDGFGNFGVDQPFEISPLQQNLDASNGDKRIIHYDSSLLRAGVDISKLPGYTADMGGFLDNCEPWSVTYDEGEFCYDEWLQ